MHSVSITSYTPTCSIMYLKNIEPLLSRKHTQLPNSAQAKYTYFETVFCFIFNRHKTTLSMFNYLKLFAERNSCTQNFVRAFDNFTHHSPNLLKFSLNYLYHLTLALKLKPPTRTHPLPCKDYKQFYFLPSAFGRPIVRSRFDLFF